jgi:DNA-binding response OmpR family regulator
MCKVILVEDNASMRSLLGTLLELEGYQVISFGDMNREELLTAVTTFNPGILILDVYLSQSNGLELLRSLQGNEQIARLRILMTSGMDLRERCIEAGANDFLLKPYMPEELVNWLHANTRN